MKKIHEISNILSKINSKEEINLFLNELLTESEIDALSKRWRILSMLKQGIPQRDIAKELNVSLCKITRGSKILKQKDSVIRKHLIKE